MITVFMILNILVLGFCVFVYFHEKNNIQSHLTNNKTIYIPTLPYILFPTFFTVLINNIFSLHVVLAYFSILFNIHFSVLLIIYISILVLVYIFTFSTQNEIVEDISWDKNYYIWGTIIYFIIGIINPLQFIGFYFINKMNFTRLSKFKIINKIQKSIENIEKRKK